MIRVLAVLIAFATPAGLAAQSLEQRVAQVRTGTVHLSFPARPGVCGSGSGINNLHDDEGDWEHDSVTVWPSLLELPRNPAVPQEMRRTAVFWLGQAAATEAGKALDTIAGDVREDREVRKQAVFALSQRESDGVPALIRIARTNPDPELRRTAIFWLGQTEDPRALALFEEILR